MLVIVSLKRPEFVLKMEVFNKIPLEFLGQMWSKSKFFDENMNMIN